MNITPGSVKGTHVLLTGPITGSVTKEDGTVVDVSPGIIEVADTDEAEEIGFLIGEHWVANGHPDDVEPDGKGNMIQRPFVHDYNQKKFGKHPSKFSGKPAGVARKV